MLRPVLRLAALCLAVAFLPMGPAPAAADFSKIQPGDYMVTSVGSCTLNFVFDGPGGKTYMGTAAHCVSSVGQVVATTQYGNFGSVAWIGDASNAARDFALIEVWSQYTSVVDPALRGHPGYPTGMTLPAETTLGDEIQVSGYGAGYDANWNTQTRRVAIHTTDNAATHSVAGPIHFGDSGGPLVHIETGKAYGIVSRLCTGICSETGPTVRGAVAYAAATGFSVTLRTV